MIANRNFLIGFFNWDVDLYYTGAMNKETKTANIVSIVVS